MAAAANKQMVRAATKCGAVCGNGEWKIGDGAIDAFVDNTRSGGGAAAANKQTVSAAPKCEAVWLQYRAKKAVTGNDFHQREKK